MHSRGLLDISCYPQGKPVGLQGKSLFDIELEGPEHTIPGLSI